MFNTLTQNSVFYILDKNTKPELKIGKVVKANTNQQFYGLANHGIDITVDVDGETYEFKNIPPNLSIANPSTGLIISDNSDDMFKEFEAIVKSSQQILDNIDYHKSIIESKDSILSVLSPQFAKDNEQRNKLSALETKVNCMEQGISDIKTMLIEVLNNKK